MTTDSHTWFTYMATSPHRARSDFPVSPGSVLKEEVEYLGMTQKELTERVGRPTRVIDEIILGNEAITSTTAIELQQALGISAQFWLNLETAYRTTLARQEASMTSTVPIQGDSA